MTRQEKEIKVLLVDDELESLDSVQRELLHRGFSVFGVSDGYAALSLFQSVFFDAVVLDVEMPPMDGVEVFHRIKNLAPEIPVVMLTGHGNAQQAFEASRRGVFDYLTKPCDIDILASTVHRAVKQRNIKYEPLSFEIAEDEIRLLFVDDEVDFLASLSIAFEKRNIRVTTAIDVAQALEHIHRQIFDVALVDVRMPGVSGLSLLSKTKELDLFMPVIILTGHPSMNKILTAVREGAFDIVIKPQSVEAITQKIREAYHFRQQYVQSHFNEHKEKTLRQTRH